MPLFVGVLVAQAVAPVVVVLAERVAFAVAAAEAVAPGVVVLVALVAMLAEVVVAAANIAGVVAAALELQVYLHTEVAEAQ